MESCAVNFVVQYDRTGFEYIRVNISNKRRVTTILIITTSQSTSTCKCLILYTSFLCEIIVFVSWHLKSAIILLMRYIFFCFLQFIVNRKGLFYFITFRQCCTEIAKESSWNKKNKKEYVQSYEKTNRSSTSLQRIANMKLKIITSRIWK